MSARYDSQARRWRVQGYDAKLLKFAAGWSAQDCSTNRGPGRRPFCFDRLILEVNLTCLKPRDGRPVYKIFMHTVFKLWDKAHEIYARARSAPDQSEKRKLMREADGYLRQAEARRQAAIVRAKYPESSHARYLVTDTGG